MDGINIVQVILILVVLVNGLFAIRFVLDVLQHKEELKEEPGNPIVMAIVSFFMFFLSTFGLSGLFSLCFSWRTVLPIWSKARESRLSNWPWLEFGC